MIPNDPCEPRPPPPPGSLDPLVTFCDKWTLFIMSPSFFDKTTMARGEFIHLQIYLNKKNEDMVIPKIAQSEQGGLVTTRKPIVIVHSLVNLENCTIINLDCNYNE